MLDITENSPEAQPRESYLALLHARAMLSARDDFAAYVRLMAPSIVPDFKWGRHIDIICRELQRCMDEGGQRIMIFLPPRSSKSLISSRLFPSWYMGRQPAHEILTISHNEQLSSDFGRSVRDLVAHPVFEEVFEGVRLRKDAKAAGKWKTNKGGSYFAAGVNSQIAGRGAHVAIIDDAMSEADAFSDAGRAYIKNWYPSGLRTRLMPGGSIVIINTRYHDDDLCGWLLRNQKAEDNPDTTPWKVIKIPAWVDEESSELLGLPVGSSYFPEWKTDELLRQDEAEIRSNNGAKYWQSLYMQNPTPDEGGIIKMGYLSPWTDPEPPNCEFILQTMDTAFSTKSTADESVLQTWGIFHRATTDSAGVERVVANLILLGNEHGRWEYPELRSLAQAEYDHHRPDLVLIEKKASGQSLIQDLRRAGLPIMEYMPDRDKVARVNASTPFMESGRIWIPSGRNWADDLLNQALRFPGGRHDDMVDAMTMAILYVRDSWRIEHPDDPELDDEPVRRQKTRGSYWVLPGRRI